MYLLKKRPLATILIVLLGGFSAFGAADTLVRVLLCLALGILYLSLCLLPKIPQHRAFMHTLCISCAISFLLSFLYFDIVFPIGKQYEGKEEVTLQGYVDDILYTDEYFTVINMKVNRLDDRRLFACTITLTDEHDALGDISVGDRLTVQATLQPTDTDTPAYTVGQCIRAAATLTERIDDGEDAPHLIRAWRAYMTDAFRLRIRDISDDQSAALLTALVLGERNELSSTTQLAFSRLGITHLLALSGLHLSILSLLLVALLSLFGVNKCVRQVILCLFVGAYIVLTGAPSSLLRAGIMLIVCSLLFLFRRSYDSVTTLCVTVFAICLFSPFAVYDLGLWLSALCTLGILLFGTDKDKSETKASRAWWMRPIIGIAQSIRLSVSAQAAALLLSVVSFETLSLVSPISTFLFGLPIQLFVYLGLFTLPLGGICPFLGKALSWLGGCITDLAIGWSQGRFVLADASFSVIRVLVLLFTILLVLFVVCKIKHTRAALVTLLCLFASVYLCAFSLTYHAVANDSQLYFTSEQSDGFVITSDTQTILVDIGSGGRAFGTMCVNTIESKRIRYLDAYILTRYTTQHLSCARTVLQQLACAEVYLPTPQTEAEEDCARSLVEMLTELGVSYTMYDPERGVSVGDTQLTMPRRGVKELQTSFWMVLADTDTRTVYFSRGSVSDKTQAAAGKLTASADTVIFGCCGYATDYILDISLSDSVRLVIFADKHGRIREDRYRQYQASTKIVLFPRQYKIKH